jgi:hypothetical protein
LNSLRFTLRFVVIQTVLAVFNKIGDFMKWARFVVFVLAILVCVNMPAQGPGGGGNCTNLGCINLPGMHGFSGGVGYCIDLTGGVVGTTGRMVRNNNGIQGGALVSKPGTFTAEYDWSGCPACNPPNTVWAIVGSRVGVGNMISWGNATCE